MIAAHENGPKIHAVMPYDAASATNAMRLARRGIAWCSSHARMVSPKRACSRSHRCQRGDEREKAHAAISRNTVVGISGRNAPTRPRTTQVQPSATYSRRCRRLCAAASPDAVAGLSLCCGCCMIWCLHKPAGSYASPATIPHSTVFECRTGYGAMELSLQSVPQSSDGAFSSSSVFDAG